MQMAEHDDGNDLEGLDAPEKLVSALRQLPQENIFVPRMMDEAVLREARRHLDKPTREISVFWRWIPRLAVVTGMLALVLVIVLVRPGSTPPPPMFAREDLNHDGRVDILDAFALARQLKSGAPSGPGTDINGDGVVDQRDVEVLATRAVRLDKGGPS
jgi:hypothetical protein